MSKINDGRSFYRAHNKARREEAERQRIAEEQQKIRKQLGLGDTNSIEMRKMKSDRA